MREISSSITPQTTWSAPVVLRVISPTILLLTRVRVAKARSRVARSALPLGKSTEQRFSVRLAKAATTYRTIFVSHVQLGPTVLQVVLRPSHARLVIFVQRRAASRPRVIAAIILLRKHRSVRLAIVGNTSPNQASPSVCYVMLARLLTRSAPFRRTFARLATTATLPFRDPANAPSVMRVKLQIVTDRNVRTVVSGRSLHWPDQLSARFVTSERSLIPPDRLPVQSVPRVNTKTKLDRRDVCLA